jgi:hypothetical protein
MSAVLCPKCGNPIPPDEQMAHLVSHRLKYKAEPQTEEVRARYIADIPVRFNERINEARHAVDHGVLSYSRQALDAYLDYGETTKAAEIMRTPPPPGLVGPELASWQQSRKESLEGIHLYSRARVHGYTADKYIFGLLSHWYVMRSIFDITADFVELTAKADHPLEECPNPPA